MALRDARGARRLRTVTRARHSVGTEVPMSDVPEPRVPSIAPVPDLGAGEADIIARLKAADDRAVGAPPAGPFRGELEAALRRGQRRALVVALARVPAGW